MKGFAGSGAVQDLRFVAVDVDITSLSSPASLVSALEPAIRAGHIGKVGRRHWVHLYVSGSASTPSAAIRRYARAFDRLRGPAQRLFARATKEFDIGFEAGEGTRANEYVLSRSDIAIVARLGATVRITVYPYSHREPE